jgi:hypothetical protein
VEEKEEKLNGTRSKKGWKIWGRRGKIDRTIETTEEEKEP